MLIVGRFCRVMILLIGCSILLKMLLVVLFVIILVRVIMRVGILMFFGLS